MHGLRYFFAVAMPTLFALNINAEVLTPEQALDRVGATPKTSTIKSVKKAAYTLRHTLEAADHMPTVYIMSNSVGQNLVLSADDHGHPLLGYFTTPNEGEMPPALVAWLDDYSRQIAEARASNIRLQKVTISDARNISPLLETMWNQDEPFNNLCPRYINESTGVDRRCPTGCVATAMAQIINYHQYPEHGIGTHTYKWNVDQSDLSFDFSAATFDYNNMISYYGGGGYTQAQADAVATLMYGCGVAIEAIYSPYSTGAMSESISPALIQYFGYDRDTRIVKRRFFPLQQWIEMMYAEVAAGRPVCYAGGNDEGAHQFVLDGYDTQGYFHVNWGWGTISNGYFLITGLDPDNQGIGGSTGGFNRNQSAIIGIQPPVDPERTPDPLMTLQFDWGPDPQTIARSTTQIKMVNFSIKASPDGGWENYCSEEQKLQLGAKFTDAEGNIYYEWSQMSPTTFRPGTYNTAPLVLYCDKRTSTNHVTVPNGIYKVTPVVKTVPEEGSTDDAKIFDAIVGLGYRQYINIKITDTEMVISNPPSPTRRATGGDVELLSPMYSTKVAKIQTTITAGSAEFFGDVTVSMVKYMDDSNVTTLGRTFMSAAPGDDAQFTWQGNLSVAPGYYYLQLTDPDGNHLTGTYVTVKEVPTAATEVSVSDINVVNAISGTGVMYDPYVVRGKELRLSYTLNCSSGYFANQVYCNILDGYSSFSNTLMPQNFIDQGDSNTQSLDIVLDKAAYDNTYTVRIKHRYTSASGYTTDQQITGGTTYFRFIEPEFTAADDITAGKTDEIKYDSVARILYAPESATEIRIIDLLGKTVLQSTSPAVDCTSLHQGIYIVTLYSSAGLQSFKIHL